MSGFKTYGLLGVLGLIVGCAPSMEMASSRDPALFDKNITVHARPVAGSSKPLDIYVKKPQVTIKPVEKTNQTGSLFNADDERNYLFASGRPAEVGRYLTVSVDSNRVPVKNAEKAQGENGDNQQADAELKELLDTMPELKPSDPAQANLIKQMRMKVVHRYDNGDAMVSFTRQSRRDDAANQISVQARIPYDRLMSGDGVSTTDLMDVQFLESNAGELIERSSSGWEDDYTLRLSGFDEAKSQLAMDLEQKRKQLMDVKSRLENKIKAFGNERQTLSKEREDLGRKRDEDQVKISQLNDKIGEQEQVIKDQQEQIKDLSPDEKPADEKEGDTGDE